MKNLVIVVLALLAFYAYFFIKKTVTYDGLAEPRDKIFMVGSIDEIKSYLEDTNNGITVGNFYSLIRRNKPEILEVILGNYGYSADLNSRELQIESPLFFAAKMQKVESVRVLIKYGADVNLENKYGVTPLIATAYPTHEHEKPASLEITKMLVEAGADINKVSRFGWRAIAGALSLHDDMERVKYLVGKGGDTSQIDRDGLNYMFHCQSLECYKYFVGKGLDINSTSFDGTNILQSSLYGNSDLEQTKQLLAWGADICHKDNSGDTVLEYVERQRTFPHDNKENPESYHKKVQENRTSEVYKFLKSEYSKRCLE